MAGIPQDRTNKPIDDDELRLCVVAHQEGLGCPPLVVTRSLIVKPDGTWMLHVNSHLVDPSLLEEIPSKLNEETASVLIKITSQLCTCAGNPDPRLAILGEKKKNGQFLSKSKSVVSLHMMEAEICCRVL